MKFETAVGPDIENACDEPNVPADRQALGLVRPYQGMVAWPTVFLAAGIVAAFILVIALAVQGIIPLWLGLILNTFVLYAALAAVFFLLVLVLQAADGFGPVLAGAALLPVTVLMLALSPRAGELAARRGTPQRRCPTPRPGSSHEVQREPTRNPQAPWIEPRSRF